VFLDSLGPSDKLVVDTETNRTDYYEERYLLGLAFYHPKMSGYIPVGHKPFMGEEATNIDIPKYLFRDVKAKLIFHNAKFDYQVMERYGLQVPRDNCEDTMIMAHWVDENQLSYSLEHLTKVLKVTQKETKIAKAMKEYWDSIPPYVMAKYAIGDCLSTYELHDKLDPLFEPYRSNWNEVDRDFMFFLASMETKGILIDVDRCAELEVLTLERMQQIEQELGFDPSKPALLRSKLFDDPPFGYGLKPLSYTPKTGKPQVNTRFLENTNHPVCGLLLEYSELKKQLTSYFRPYQKLGHLSGRLHPSFKQHGTVTGRLSCENPNLQQVPRDSKVKEIFLPEDGHDLVEIDYSNLEMRLMAVYCKQPALLEIFSKRDGDVHQLTADLIGIPRYDAKQANFTIGYGGGWSPLDQYIKKGEKASRAIIDNWHKTYPEVKKVSYQAQYAAEKNNGTVKMWTGRERHFRFKSECHKAFNNVIQGGGFEIVKRSCVLLHKVGFDIRNQVHDSVWINSDNPQDIKEAEAIMEGWALETFELPFFVESKTLKSRK